jgi:hypothetical protein
MNMSKKRKIKEKKQSAIDKIKSESKGRDGNEKGFRRRCAKGKKLDTNDFNDRNKDLSEKKSKMKDDKE